jgi:hypothetical protein
MNITIDSITLIGFGKPDPAVGGQTQAIVNYDGSTLYCHVTPNATNTVDIVFNQSGPNEYVGEGQIASVTLQYQNTDVSPPLQIMSWTSNLPDGSYLGGTLKPYLSFAPNLSQASLVLQNAGKVTGTKDASSPQLTMVLLGTELTLSGTRGYFVNVPIDPASDYQSITSARVRWPKTDSMVGPIGSVDVP